MIPYFTFYIPISTDMSHYPNPNTNSNTNSYSNSNTNTNTNPLKINFNFYKLYISSFLIDTPSNSKMLSMLLRGRGILCDTASNGLEAVDLVKEQGEAYDLIFMDFTMPVMVSTYMQCSVLLLHLSCYFLWTYCTHVECCLC